jgi:hypothetical protein
MSFTVEIGHRPSCLVPSRAYFRCKLTYQQGACSRSPLLPAQPLSYRVRSARREGSGRADAWCSGFQSWSQ